MGEDGHFASLFPNMGTTINDSPYCLHTCDTNNNPRVSLSPKSLLSIKNIHLCIIGEGKLKTFERAKRSNDIDNMPINLLLKSNAAERLTVHFTK